MAGQGHVHLDHDDGHAGRRPGRGLRHAQEEDRAQGQALHRAQEEQALGRRRRFVRQARTVAGARIRARRSESHVKTATAAHTRTNPAQRDAGIASCLIATPITNWMIGATYWSRPIVVSGIRTAAAPKSISGTAVAMPPPASSSTCPAPSVVSVPFPVACRTTMHASAGTNRNVVSTARLCVPPTPTCFLTSP